MFFNFDEEEKELEHQYQVLASLEIIDYKVNLMKGKNEQFLGLLMPLYENEYDLGSFGFIGTNSSRIILIKKMVGGDEDASNKNIHKIMYDVYNKYCKLLMNPFFDKNDLKDSEKTSKIKTTFLKDIETLIQQFNTSAK